MIETNLDGFHIVILPHEENDGKTLRAYRLNERQEMTDVFNLPLPASAQIYVSDRCQLTNDELRSLIEQEAEEQRRKIAAELVDPLAGPEAGGDGSSPSP